MITKQENNFKTMTVLFAVLLGGGVLALAVQEISVPQKVQNSNLQAAASAAPKEEIKAPPDPFENVSLTAHAAYVYDLKTDRVLFARDENEKMPLASVTKLMTAFVARENMPLDALLTTTADDLTTDGDSGLRPGEKWRLGNLLDVMLIVSSNDAAHAIGRFVGSQWKDIDPATARTHFVILMNDQAQKLNLTSMQFFNETGLDVSETVNGGYGSAHDVALLLSELWKRYPDTLEITTRKDARIYSENGIAHILPNTDEALPHIPGLLASKTGYTTVAGGNLAVLFDRGIGDPVAVVVLGSGYAERFDDVAKLAEIALTEEEQPILKTASSRLY